MGATTGQAKNLANILGCLCKSYSLSRNRRKNRMQAARLYCKRGIMIGRHVVISRRIAGSCQAGFGAIGFKVFMKASNHSMKGQVSLLEYSFIDNVVIDKRNLRMKTVSRPGSNNLQFWGYCVAHVVMCLHEIKCLPV